MLKGCQKEMIVLHTTDSPLFEDAFFVLRAGRPSPAHADMIAEANRIVMGGRGYFLRGHRGRAVWLFFGAGVLVGTDIFFLLRFLIGF